MIQNWLWRILNCQSCSRYLMVFSIRIGLVLIVFNCLAILTDLRILRIWSEYKQICQNAKPSYPTKIAWAWIRSLSKILVLWESDQTSMSSNFLIIDQNSIIFGFLDSPGLVLCACKFSNETEHYLITWSPLQHKCLLTGPINLVLLLLVRKWTFLKVHFLNGNNNRRIIDLLRRHLCLSILQI